MNKSTKSQIDRAITTGNASHLAATLAVLHRCSNAKTQKEIFEIAYTYHLMSLLTMVNGCLVTL